MKSGYILKQRTYISISILALALLIISFIAIDSHILETAAGEYQQLIGAIFLLLIIYYVFSIARAIVSFRESHNKSYNIMAIVVCTLALFTFAIDKLMFAAIARLYQDGFGFSGEQRMLLISLLIKFLALIVSVVSAVSSEKRH